MAFLPSLDTLLAAILIPALIALAIYLISIYILYPLYAHRRRYAHYLPVSLEDDPSSLLSRTRTAVRNTGILAWIGGVVEGLRDRIRFPGLAWRMRSDTALYASRLGRGDSVDTYFGDEELEDGILTSAGMNHHGSGERAAGRDAGSERRLSRELEAGFRDDSSSEDEHERGRPSRRL